MILPCGRSLGGGRVLLYATINPIAVVYRSEVGANRLMRTASAGKIDSSYTKPPTNQSSMHLAFVVSLHTFSLLLIASLAMESLSTSSCFNLTAWVIMRLLSPASSSFRCSSRARAVRVFICSRATDAWVG